MTKLTISLVAVVLAAILDGGLSGSIHYRNWDQFSGNQIGFATGKCSALSGLLPEPKSGCCGRHAGADKDNGDNEENNDGDENNEIGGGDNEGDDDDGHFDGGNNDTDDGESDVDNSENDIGNGDDDMDDGWNGDNSNGIDWVGGIGDIIEDVGSIYDDMNKIFDVLGLADDSQSEFDGFNLKSVKDNSSDIPPDGYITEGKRAGLRQYPWLVHLNIKVREMTKIIVIGCGGSLISPRFVLTAAHCVAVNYQTYDDVNIFLAEYNTNTYPTDCVGNTCVKNVVMHPDKIIKHRGFEPNLLENDIALMRLRGSAPYTEFIRPICLPPFNIDVPKNHGTPLSIAGWGSTGRAASPIKLTAQVKLVAHGQCQRHYRELTHSHICAASNNGQDTCQGDSGGPIMAERDGNYYVVGIVSGKSGQTSCGSSVPTLYTNVYKFTKWIQDNMRL